MRLSFSVRTIAVLLYVVAVAILLSVRLALPVEEAFGSDAATYSAVAEHVAQGEGYTLDGVTPYVEREPGYSLFLGLLYAVFGVQNRVAIFLAQAFLYLVAAWGFSLALRKITSDGAASLCLFLLLAFPAVHHIVFSVLRESLALTLFLGFSSAMLLLSQKQGSFRTAAGGGVCLGLLMITYVPYVLFPPFVLVLGPLLKIRWRFLAVLLVVSAIPLSVWAARNVALTGEACVTGCHRSAIQWYVRGEQSQTIRGLEPLWCLRSEYVTRDWTGRDPNCSFNAVMHRRWPDGFQNSPSDVAAGAEGQANILAHFGNYLWFSLFEILELHVPYVNGWGRTYNLFALAGSLIVYLGCVLWLFSRRWKREYLLFLAIIGYTTGIFILTDATPRYLMPVIFAYAAFAAIGYARVWAWLKRLISGSADAPSS